MKRILYTILCLLMVCINSCTDTLLPFAAAYEQKNTRWNAKELDMSLCVTDDNETYGSLTIDGTTQYFYMERPFAGNPSTFYTAESEFSNLTHDEEYLLQCHELRTKSSSEYRLYISNSNIDLGDIEELTFIRQDAEPTNPPLATRKQICEKYDIPMKDEYGFDTFSGIDVEAVIQHFQITEKDIAEGTSDDIINELKTLQTEMFEDVAYMFEGGTPEIKIPIPQTKRIVFQVENNGRKDFWNISLPSGRTYHKVEVEHTGYSFGELDSMSAPSIVELLMILDEVNMHRLPAVSDETERNETDNRMWRLGIESTDGAVYSWCGTGETPDRCRVVTYVITNNWDE